MKAYRNVLIAAIASFGMFAATAVVAGAEELPDAPGKRETLASCTGCHGVDLIVAQRRSAEDWSQMVSRMVGNGATLTDEQYQTVLAYLTKNLGNAPGSTPASAAN